MSKQVITELEEKSEGDASIVVGISTINEHGRNTACAANDSTISSGVMH